MATGRYRVLALLPCMPYCTHPPRPSAKWWGTTVATVHDNNWSVNCSEGWGRRWEKRKEDSTDTWGAYTQHWNFMPWPASFSTRQQHYKSLTSSLVQGEIPQGIQPQNSSHTHPQMRLTWSNIRGSLITQCAPEKYTSSVFTTWSR